MDTDGNLIVGCTGPDEQVLRIQPDGTHEALLNETGLFEEILSLQYIPSTTSYTVNYGDLLFFTARVSTGEEQLMVLNPETKTSWILVEGLPSPMGALAKNADDRLFVTAGGILYRVDPDSVLTEYLHPDALSPRFFDINRDDLFLIEDTLGQQVAVLKADGGAFPLARGLGDIGGLTLGPDGYLYLAEKSQGVILRIPYDFQTMVSGRVAVSPEGPITAGNLGTWYVTYEVGPAGMSRAGMFRIGFPHPVDWSLFQSVFPNVVNYLTSVSFWPETVSTVEALWDLADNYAEVRISGEPLQRGDRIQMTMGDKSYGGPGQKAPTVAFEDTNLFVFDDIYGRPDAFDSIFTVPEDRIHRYSVVSDEPDHLFAAVKSYGRPGEPVVLSLRAKDRYGNVATDYTGTVQIYDSSTMSLLETVAFGSSDQGLRIIDSVSFPAAGVKRLLIRDEARGWNLLSNPIVIEEVPETQVFWGDLHGHSLLSDGFPSPEQYYTRAMLINQMDFAALTDHVGGPLEIRNLLNNVLNPSTFEPLKQAAQQFYAPGDFVTFVGLELSLPSGHRNVYYAIPDPPFVGYRLDLEALFQSVRESADPGQVMVIGHQHSGIPGQSGLDWSTLAPDLERMVEICSNKGVREYAGNPYFVCDIAADNHGDEQVVTQDALAMGLRVGFVGASDNHSGWPGGGGSMGWHLCPIFGLTSVRATELTREAIWEALYNRETVATTGPRILLDFYLNGEPMGSELPATAERHLEIEVHATTEIESVDILKNNEVLYAVADPGMDVSFSLDDAQTLETDFYYVRVIQVDRHLAWCSPIWVGQ
jgi:hypothetical protein